MVQNCLVRLIDDDFSLIALNVRMIKFSCKKQNEALTVKITQTNKLFA